MQTITQEQFFAALKASPRDIMPSNMDPDVTLWKDQHTGEVMGKSWPGWHNPEAPKVWMLETSLLAALGVL